MKNTYTPYEIQPGTQVWGGVGGGRPPQPVQPVGIVGISGTSWENRYTLKHKDSRGKWKNIRKNEKQLKKTLLGRGVATGGVLGVEENIIRNHF